MNDSIKLHFYSERGLVDYLIIWLKYRATSDQIADFLKMLDNSINDYKEINVYNEYSFGEFGSPDLIIKIELLNGKTKVFLIEAKIDSFEKASTSKKNSNNYKNASKINIQLLLRKKFVMLLNKEPDTLFLFEKGYTTKNGRALYKKELVEWANGEIKGDYEYYYVALVKDNPNKENIWDEYFSFKEKVFDEEQIVLNKNELVLLSWKDIYESFFIDDCVFKDIVYNTDRKFFD